MTERPATARERARQDVMAQILEAGRRELAEHGAGGLSLRAVAREVGMVSSAVYRYVSSKDELLTALIIEAYDDVGAAAEKAAGGRTTPGRRFVRVLAAIRTWANEHPHQYALVHGSPVPGYEAPQRTVESASRAPLAAGRLVQEAYDAGTLDVDRPTPKVSRALGQQCTAIRDALGFDAPDVVIVRFMQAWTQAYGLISFELFGQLVGSFDPADAFAAHTFTSAAEHVGFTDL
ncbi:TetR/AcrR family transcriptional regulator [Luteipulveratus halotolerans]|uniref:HTH tetR-type domain-containing protein n=1 Tax=Luteipulveratus halotolerans TaxID=1631356 RepID=A0A0L6CEW5_9MICO|nr:TetR/AcrR family transcriptional regulator [Luteipulveratus halotolerans]KNX36110.1 hypothetical protein VV01_01415 [Luteipulveratus halotolerans]